MFEPHPFRCSKSHGEGEYSRLPTEAAFPLFEHLVCNAFAEGSLGGTPMLVRGAVPAFQFDIELPIQLRSRGSIGWGGKSCQIDLLPTM